MYLSDLPAFDMRLAGDHPCYGCPVRDQAVCNALADDELAEFRRSGTCRQLAPGEVLCWEGDEARQVFSLSHGVLRLSKLLLDGRRQIAGFAFPGDFVGVTMDDEHPFTVEAVTPAKLCRFPRPRFDAFVEQHPHMERRLYTAAAHELSAAREQLLVLGRRSAAARLASFIVQMARRTEQFDDGPIRVLFPMSRTDLADYLGLRIETVSRELGALKAARIVRMLGVHELLILEREGLNELAAG